MTAVLDPQQGVKTNLPGLLALALASCLAVTTEMLPVGLLPAMSASLGVNESTTGLLVTLYAVMVAALSVPLTLATKRFSRKPLLLSTVFLYAVSNAIVAVAPTFAVVAVGRTVGGITHALFFSLCIGYAPRLVGAAHVGRALAIATGGASAGFVLGVPLSTSLGTAVGWRTSFLVLAALSAVTLALVAKFLPAVGSDSIAPTAETHTGRKQLTLVVTSNSLTYLGQFTVYTFISLLLIQAGAGPGFVGPLLLMCGACGLVGLWYAGRTVDRHPARTAMTIMAVVVVAVLGVGTAFPALVAVVVCAAVWNGAFGGMPSLYQACAVRAHATSPEMAGAWVNSTANIGIAGGAAIGGVLLPTIGLGGLPFVGAGLIFLGAVVLIGALKLTSRPAPTDRPAPATA